MNIKFKTVCFKDKLYIWDVYKAAMIAHIEKIWGWNESWQENDFSKNLKKYKTFVLVVNDIPLGYIQYKENKDNVYINMIILEPSYQGNKIGKYILIKLQEQSLNKPIRLKCFKKNKRAYKFYKNNGFELIEEDLDFYLLCLSNKIIG